MRSLFRLGFFVFFASLQSSLGMDPCGYGFVRKEGNAVGRGFKNWDNYTHAKSVVDYDNCINLLTLLLGVQRLAPVRGGVAVTSSVRKRRDVIWTRKASPQILEVTLGTTSSAGGGRALGSALPAWCHNCPCKFKLTCEQIYMWLFNCNLCEVNTNYNTQSLSPHILVIGRRHQRGVCWLVLVFSI